MEGENNMRKYIVVFIAIVLYGNLTSCQTNQKKFPELTGPYLGQKPPGMKPEIFAPGVLSTDANEFNAAFTPSGDAVYFTGKGE
ncbi:MAG: hypothetical protein E4G95_02190, partial [Bacteroidia bacterium]